MPLQKDLRRVFYDDEWNKLANRLRLERAGNMCEWCNRENGALLPAKEGKKPSKVVLTTAHLNQIPGDNREENLAVLCQRCHLNYDRNQHQANIKVTRVLKKDGARELLQLIPPPMIDLHVGDIVFTSYKTGPYEIMHVSRPSYFYQLNILLIRTYPVVSLTVRELKASSGKGWLNNIRQMEGRFLTDGDDEIFIQRRSAQPREQGMLFDDVDSGQPYRFQPGVDYSTAYHARCAAPELHISFSDWQVFHCRLCQRDFNGHRTAHVARCPDCQKWNGIGYPVVIFTPNNEAPIMQIE